MDGICIGQVNETDFSENVDYNIKEYPMYIRRGKLSQYPNFSAASHWHEDLEFISILSGHMNYNVNGTIVNIPQGNGIFINSRQFHHGFSTDHTECEFICLLLHPLLLCINEYYESHFVTPVISNTQQPYLILSKDTGWHRQVMNILADILLHSQKELDILYIQQLLFKLWIPFYNNFPTQQKQSRPDHQLAAVKNMVAFIQNHYQNALTLEMIAASGNMCKSSCLALFHKYLSQTPVSYLTQYRLAKSVHLLLHTDLTIMEISFEAGFNNASYYSETFKKYYHCTPKQYVKKMKNLP